MPPRPTTLCSAARSRPFATPFTPSGFQRASPLWCPLYGQRNSPSETAVSRFSSSTVKKTASFPFRWLAILPLVAPVPLSCSSCPTLPTINSSADRTCPSGAQSSPALSAECPAARLRVRRQFFPPPSQTHEVCAALLPYICALRGSIHNHLVLAQEPERRVKCHPGIGHHIHHCRKCRGFPSHIRHGSRADLAIDVGCRARLLAKRQRFRAVGVGSDADR